MRAGKKSDRVVPDEFMRDQAQAVKEGLEALATKAMKAGDFETWAEVIQVVARFAVLEGFYGMSGD